MASSHLISIVLKLLVFCFEGTVSATFSSLNIAVNMNSETKLTCTCKGSCENVNWYKSVGIEGLSLFQGNKRRIVDPSYTLAGDYNTTTTGNNLINCELHIKDITMLHAGRYYCQRFEVDGVALTSINFFVAIVESSFPEVRVLSMAPDSETTATTRVVNGQLVSLTCSVTYYTSNDFSVIMEYSIPGISLPPRNAVIVGTTAYLYENISVTQDLSRRNFQCKFRLRGTSSFGDSNIIEMESQLPEVQMPYPPANITVGDGRDTPYYVVEEITCIADALPLPYYIWNRQSDNLIVYASTKTFTCDDSTAGSTYVCVASNTQGFIRSTPIQCEKKIYVIWPISAIVVTALLSAIVLIVIGGLLSGYLRPSRRLYAIKSDSSGVNAGNQKEIGNITSADTLLYQNVGVYCMGNDGTLLKKTEGAIDGQKQCENTVYSIIPESSYESLGARPEQRITAETYQELRIVT